MTGPDWWSGTVAPNDVDVAIRRAAKVAIDAGDYGRTRALLHLLETTPRSSVVQARTGTRRHRLSAGDG
jgi:hypothetical protein